ncbi:MAG: hypothetical protein HUJ98_15410 [Bacteroidaceae bacterium]|nr:hypothetical protein [Bacteroidaceae bacterium]
MMKNFLSYLIIAVMLLCGAACSKDNSADESATPPADLIFIGKTKDFTGQNDTTFHTGTSYSIDFNKEAMLADLHIYNLEIGRQQLVQIPELILKSVPVKKSTDRLYTFRTESIVPVLKDGSLLETMPFTNLNGMFANTTGIGIGASGKLSFALTTKFHCLDVDVIAETKASKEK